MNCKSRGCECNAASSGSDACGNKFCKNGHDCPAKVCRSNQSREELEYALVHMDGHIKECLRSSRPIDLCFDNSRRKILRALAELPLQWTRSEQNRLLKIEEEAKELATVLFNAGVPTHGHDLGERTYPYLTRMFRGMCLQGMFRGRH